MQVFASSTLDEKNLALSIGSRDVISVYDILLVVAVYIYVMVLIYVSELLRRTKGLSAAFTRRMIHLFAGDAILLLPLFSHWIYPFMIPLGLAILVSLVFTFKKSSFITTSMIEEGDVVLHAYGPVYYILSILIMVPLFWGKGGELSFIAATAAMVMAWGDGTASLIPKKLKKVHKYPFSDKSFEGSLSMFVFSFLGSLLALVLCNLWGGVPRPLMIHEVFLLALISAVTGTVVEAITLGPLRHFDNFTVPFAVAAVLYIVSYTLL
ncbi:MAG: hypothetical protein DRJ52_06550 [Thermoprotei archaeon]|nr:MAG: hypothetical protein DRJ52_06550 [Thermoprotei archaeon]